MNTPRKVYSVLFKVRPSPEHPKFFGMQFGYLFTWIAQHSPEAAAESARTVVGVLPFELAVDKVRVQEVGEQPYPQPEFNACVAQAKHVGFAMFLAACETGTDEEGFGDDLA